MAEATRDRIQCALMRGGTSRGIVVLDRDLPKDAKRRDEVLMAMLGNPDPFQVDGLGGGTPWTSVVAILAEAQHGKGDLEVACGRLVPGASSVDYSTVCGDLLAAAAEFAIDQKLVKAKHPSASVHMIAAGGQNVVVEVPVKGDRARIEGPCLVADLPRSGACIRVTFKDINADLGRLFPTGHQREGVTTPYGEYVVSIVDAITPVVFVNAGALGLTGTELPDQLESDAGLLDRAEAIRGAAAEALGLVADRLEAGARSPVRPRLVTVFESVEYHDLAGRHISVMDTDLTCREAWLDVFHYAFDAEVAACTAIAAQMDGTVVWDALLREAPPRVVNIGHPSGVISIEVDVERRKDGPWVKSASFETTARRIMDGFVYV